MKIAIKAQHGNELTYLVEREKGTYNNITESVIVKNTSGLDENEIKTAGWLMIKPIALRVFETIEPLDEPENPIGFKLIPSRIVKTEYEKPQNFIQNSEAYISKKTTDQYGQTTTTSLKVDTNTVGTITIDSQELEIIARPIDEKAQAIDMLTYLMKSDDFLSLLGITTRKVLAEQEAQETN